jgi:hypothetical protein
MPDSCHFILIEFVCFKVAYKLLHDTNIKFFLCINTFINLYLIQYII